MDLTHPATDVSRLCSLSEWSKQHISSIFESATDERCIQAIQATFSESIRATMNGTILSREELVRRVLAMRRSSKSGLRVVWRRAVDSALDPQTNRDGNFEGYYVIQRLRKEIPGMCQLVEFERHKTVGVTIQSQSPVVNMVNIDSRMIVKLDFVAEDVMVDGLISEV